MIFFVMIDSFDYVINKEALASIPLSFKRQEETSESILVIEKVSIMRLH